MKHTFRIAHLAFRPSLSVGDKVKRGQIIGRMGSSGQSTKAHVHADSVEGIQTKRYTLADIEKNKPRASSPRQMNYFIDIELFGVVPIVTTPYADVDYQSKLGKVHFGYDVVPSDWNKEDPSIDIHWPRSMDGVVSLIDYDEKGYGHCVYISYDDGEKEVNNG
jgi:hypothetical protein